MPYIGNAAGNRFVASKAASVYSGNGSTTAFTLEHAVGSDEDILVSVDGVIQEPSVAYAVSNGTTLTFTAAPSSNSGNNIFVYYLFRTVGTIDHPSTSALTATSGTFSTDLTVDTNTLKVDSTNNRVGVGTASPAKELDVVGTVQVKKSGQALNLNTPSSSQNVWINFSDNGSAKWEIQKNTANLLNIYSYDASANVMSFDGTGAVTKPLQPAFAVHPSSDQLNIAASASAVTVAFGTERFDQNGDFASNTFTAPVTGRYQLNASIYLNNVDSASNYVYMAINTSNQGHYFIIDPDFGQDSVYWSITGSVLTDMDANDTANIQIVQETSTVQMDINQNSRFSGYLVA